MYALVIDVEAYPQFLPLCQALRIKKRTEAEGRLVLIAHMQIGYMAIRESFTSKAVCDPENLEILVEYVDGPFKHLKNRWKFTDAQESRGKSCLVEFQIDYEFKNKALGLLMGGMFDIAFRSFAEAFEKRADKIYGRNTLAGNGGK
jgi:coenzyme Q-binding protein COQ10